MLTLKPVVARPRRVRHTVVRTRADLNEGVALAGKFLGSFVLFASTLNWWHYRRIRKNFEDKK